LRLKFIYYFQHNIFKTQVYIFIGTILFRAVNK